MTQGAVECGRIALVPHESLLVLLARHGASIDPTALATLEDARPTWVRIEREGESSCLAARVSHTAPPEVFRDRVRRWRPNGSGP